jgi:hypothetical protein
MKRGSVNHAIGALGVPGTGKSTWALHRVRTLQHELRCYAVAHDPSFRLPDEFPNGQPSGVRRFGSVSEARATIATDPRGVIAIATADAGEVVDFACEISDASMKANSDDGQPCIVLVDEIVSAEQASSYRLGEQFRQLLALRRWKHVGVVWTSQSPQLCHYQLLSLSTELALFRVTDKRALRRLVEAGVDEETVNLLPRLPDHKCYVVRIGG